MIQALRWLLAAGLAANASAMLLASRWWYDTLPGVVYTGPFNGHFVRDVGCAFLTAAIGMAWLAWRPAQGRPAAVMGASFLLLHAGVHVGETLTGLCGWSVLLRDLPGVVGPAVLALILSLPWHESPAPGLSTSIHP